LQLLEIKILDLKIDLKLGQKNHFMKKITFIEIIDDNPMD